jgi:hypothetical protein
LILTTFGYPEGDIGAASEKQVPLRLSPLRNDIAYWERKIYLTADG